MICVLTCPRPVNYLPATLRSIDASAKSKNRIVVVDGDYLPKDTTGWQVVYAPKPSWDYRIHNRFPFWRCLELAVEADEDLVFFEDDVLLCKNGAAYIESYKIPNGLAFVSFFSPELRASDCIATGLPIKNFAFLQGCKFPLETCKKLVEMKSAMVSSQLGGSDNCVGKVGNELGWKYGIHCPSIVQHVGRESVVSGVDTNRVSPTFRNDLDAMTIRGLKVR